MATDLISAEILRIKRELSARFDNDLDRIIADAQSRERDTINLPPRRCPVNQCNPLPATDASGSSEVTASATR